MPAGAVGCDDVGLEESAAGCRLGAAAGMELLQPFDDSESGSRAGAILVDVLRRAGQFALLGMPIHARTPECDGDIQAGPGAQRRPLILAGDRAAHTMEETIANVGQA